MDRENFAAVVVNRKIAAVDRIFHYIIPPGLAGRALCGSIVSIPFGRGDKPLEGVIVEISAEKPALPQGTEFKEIIEVLSPRPYFRGDLLELSQWIARYYCCPWVAVLQAMLPAGLSLTGKIKKNQRVQIYYIQELNEKAKLTQKQEEIYKYLDDNPGLTLKNLENKGFSPDICRRMILKGYLRGESLDIEEDGEFIPAFLSPLNAEQEKAYTNICREIDGEKRPFLLWGITGSGKTEIYARLLERVISRGKQGLLLVPEIALTTQTVDFLKKRLNIPLAVLHSGLKKSERQKTWEEISKGEYPLVIGARSAVFAPLPDLGLIIMDEEHETSYKQESAPRFHCRGVAKKRCQITGAQLVLGSATPSVEIAYKAKTREYSFAFLKNRYFGAALPKVEIIDMRRELREGNSSLFSRFFIQAIKERLNKGQQSLVLLNRRGFFTFFSCRECGESLFCPHCSIPLAYHKEENILKCHYCGFRQAIQKNCPQCGSEAIGSFGAGTQRVVAEAKRLFPEARIARLDYDAAEKRGSYEEIYRSMLSGDIDILVGTQMIAKGLDFPNISLAGVLAADLTLNLPDWRAGERTFQLLTQLIGRSGRRKQQGQAIIQTYNPQAPSIIAAANQNYGLFYRRELAQREAFGYPPFGELIRIIINGKNRQAVSIAAFNLAEEIKTRLNPQEVCGAAPAPWEKAKDRYRWHILLKGQSLDNLRTALDLSVERQKKAWDKDIFIQVDVDPYSFM